MREVQVAIVGGGIAGIACARTLQARGIDFLLIECSSTLGGRIQSDSEAGFIFDRGFQVFNSAYSKTVALLQGTGIQFGDFRSGALIKTDEGLFPLCDPFREPLYLLPTLLSPIGSPLDRLRMLKLRSDTVRGKIDPDRTTLEELLHRGFSNSMIERFFRPFLGGVFLERGLKSSASSLQAVFRNFSLGTAQLPQGGMGEISRSMASPLDKSRILLGRRVTLMTKNLIRLDHAEEIVAQNVVSALDVDSLRGIRPDIMGLPKMLPVSNLYFTTTTQLPIGRFLVLNGTGDGEINNVVALSEVVRGYAPEGKTLLSVSVLGQVSNAEAIASELESWFPGGQFQFLRSYQVPAALPEQYYPPATFEKLDITLCGDYLAPASIEGAVVSGIQIGEQLCQQCFPSSLYFICSVRL
jgi:protoporphyrinogen oxidase